MPLYDCICPKNSKGVAIAGPITLACHLLAPAEDSRKSRDKNVRVQEAPRLRVGGLIIPGEMRRVYSERDNLVVRDDEGQYVGKIVNKVFIPSRKK